MMITKTQIREAENQDIYNYGDSLDHIRDLLCLLDLFLKREVDRFRNHLNRGGTNDLRGLCITDQEIDALFELRTHEDDPVLQNLGISEKELPDRDFEERVQSRRQGIANRKDAVMRQGMKLRLETLRQCFCLDSFSQEVLVLCLAPEIDPAYSRVYAYLNDDITRSYPSVELALRVIGKGFHKVSLREAFLGNSPLIKHKLVRLQDIPPDIPGPLTRKSIVLDRRVAEFLLGSDQPDSALKDIVSLVPPKDPEHAPIFYGRTAKQIRSLRKLDPADRPLLAFIGPDGAGKKTWCLSIARHWTLPVLIVDLRHLDRTQENHFELLNLAFRECKLQGAIPCLDGLDAMVSHEIISPKALGHIRSLLSEFDGPVFITSRESIYGLSFPRMMRVVVPKPPYQERIILWDRLIAMTGKVVRSKDVQNTIDPVELAGCFRLTPGQIWEAITEARNVALLRCGNDSRFTREDIFKGGRSRVIPDMGGLAIHIRPKFRWEDLVLPSDIMKQLQDIGAAFKNKEQVFNDWGFSKKFTHGRGLNVLFYGPSGTGKTMAAEILAGELGLDMYKIDLSQMVSKYIGETEKHLDRVFNAAEQSNIILFFDEADALFGKRSEIHEARDRYANVEVSYLLQKMEEHEGRVILATNFKQNLDEAFMRRLQYQVEFPFPDPDNREHIWKGLYPNETPVDPDIDYHFLAQRFELTGGHLRSAALGAAFLAANEDRPITMEDIIISVAREYRKLGKLCIEADFGRFLEVVQG